MLLFAASLAAELQTRHPMIDCQGLTKQYGQLRAVDDLTFRVQPGEVLGFLGPNGAGKSTTMRIVTGFFPPTTAA